MVSKTKYQILKTAVCGLLFLLLACNNKSEVKNVVAKFGENVLAKEDIPSGLSQEDQELFIDSWIENQLYLDEFDKNNLPSEEIDIRVENYKNSLKKYAIEQYLVKQRLDTVVNESEIQSYYESHKQDFELKDFLVKVLYLKIPSDAPDYDKVQQWYLLKNPKDSVMMQDYAKLYAVNYYYDNDSWVYFDDILKEVPLENFNKKQFIAKKTKTNFEDNGFAYFLNIYDFRLKDAVSPLEFEKENIRQRIINTRIKNIRKKLKKELLDNAYANNKIQSNIK